MFLLDLTLFPQASSDKINLSNPSMKISLTKKTNGLKSRNFGCARNPTNLLQERRLKIMYAVVATGGKQYRVQEGQTLRIEKIPGDPGSEVFFDQVLLYSDGEALKIGQPVLDGVTVKGHIVEQGKAKKILVFKYKRRKRFRRKQGHRQPYTAVKIDAIEA
jgi:large subunit ribosomal protein L21